MSSGLSGEHWDMPEWIFLLPVIQIVVMFAVALIVRRLT